MLLNKHNLSIGELASKDESRYTLRAIRVTSKETAVTNGHYLVMVTMPEMADANFPVIEGFTPTNGSTQPFLLHSDDAKAIGAAIPKKVTIPVLAHASVGGTAERIEIATTDLDTPKRFTPRKVGGQFPNIEMVIPKDDAATLTIGLDADYLLKLAKSALATCKGDGRGDVKIKLQFKDANSAVKMTAHNSDTGQDWTAVLMPVRL